MPRPKAGTAKRIILNAFVHLLFNFIFGRFFCLPFSFHFDEGSEQNEHTKGRAEAKTKYLHLKLPFFLQFLYDFWSTFSLKMVPYYTHSLARNKKIDSMNERQWFEQWPTMIFIQKIVEKERNF